MHLTLKKETTRPPGMNSLQQQVRFDQFVREFNLERPHEALAMKTPAQAYSASPRPYTGLPDLSYPLPYLMASGTAKNCDTPNPKQVQGVTETVSADVSDLAQTISAVAGSTIAHLLVGPKYDVIVWRELWPRIMGNAIEACTRANTRYLDIFLSRSK